MKKIFAVLMLMTAGFASSAQQKPDTVVVELANSSRVVFTIKDRKDLPILRQYNFQALFTDILNRIEETPVTPVSDTDSVSLLPVEPREAEIVNEPVTWDDGDATEQVRHIKVKSVRKFHHSANLDLGVNNYLSDGKFPDTNNELHSVRPWGSWYVGINSVQHMRVSRKFFVEWGLGLSWYNFKFQQDNILVSKDENGVIFSEDARNVNFIKSKLGVTYANVSLIPMLDFGGRGVKARFGNSYDSNFRIGAGPYAGYRISSRAKQVYDDGGREKDKYRDNFYLNNFRYGVRVQLGIRSTDLFFNYDLNELFSTEKPNNPKLNAFSFGIIF
ncbi:MAG: hypothetical protein KF845_13185 [Cyclobacteriaceae bacterium]|nr:hypothetical protein [Cyclobacteriaceae bacterium]